MSDTTETHASQESHETCESAIGSEMHSMPHTPANPAPAEPADVEPPLAVLIATIRSAVLQGASAETRAAGATACRSILTVLEAKPGQPLVTGPQPTASPASPLASMLSQPGFLSRLAAMSREQLLELVKQVTGAVSPRTQTPAAAAPRFHLIQVPQAPPTRQWPMRRAPHRLF